MLRVNPLVALRRLLMLKRIAGMCASQRECSVLWQSRIRNPFSISSLLRFVGLDRGQNIGSRSNYVNGHEIDIKLHEFDLSYPFNLEGADEFSSF